MPDMAITDLGRNIGKVLGISPWVLIDQTRITAFADITGDHQFIHVDPERAQKTPFGGTIAHGLLTLSLLPALAAPIIPVPPGVKMTLNYGYDKIRFLTPVPSGSRVRAVFRLLACGATESGQWRQVVEILIEIEGGAKPALIAEQIILSYL
jgi:acyl dehydratase